MIWEICSDNRFEVIELAKKYIIKATNIESAKDEMACLDSFLFRCWQLKLLERFKAEANNYKELNFSQAFYLLNHDKKIRRKCWKTGEHLFIEDGKVLLYSWDSSFGCSFTRDITINSEDLLANDWEVANIL